MVQNLVASFQIPGYNPPNATPPEVAQDSSDASPKPGYKIPPVVWPILFLVIGYIGVHFMVEEG